MGRRSHTGGEPYVDPHLEEVREAIRERAAALGPDWRTDPIASRLKVVADLPPRLFRVGRLLVVFKDPTEKRIGEQIYDGKPSTFKTYVQHVFDALHVDHRAAFYANFHPFFLTEDERREHCAAHDDGQ